MRAAGHAPPAAAGTARHLVLGLETGGEHLSVALLESPIASVALLESLPTGVRVVGELRAHRGSKHLDLMLGLIAELLARAEVTPAELSLIAVGRGPGGFTGVRLGLSLAQGLAIASGVPVWPVSSLAALALNATLPGTAVLALLDAKKGEVYAAAYRLQEGAPPLTLLAPRAGTCESALAAAREASGRRPEGLPTAKLEGAHAAGDEDMKRLVVLGSGALAYGVASALQPSAHVASATATAQLALYEWAAAGMQASASPPVDAAYLRKSEAEVMADARDLAAQQR